MARNGRKIYEAGCGKKIRLKCEELVHQKRKKEGGTVFNFESLRHSNWPAKKKENTGGAYACAVGKRIEQAEKRSDKKVDRPDERIFWVQKGSSAYRRF